MFNVLASLGSYLGLSRPSLPVELCGSLYVRGKSDWECLYALAVARVASSDDPWTSYLDVLLDSDDSELSDTQGSSFPDKDAVEFKHITLQKEILFGVDSGPRGHGFSFEWNNKRYLFEYLPGTSDIMVSSFKRQCCEAIFSHNMRRKAASDAEWQAMCSETSRLDPTSSPTSSLSKTSNLCVSRLLPGMEGSRVVCSAMGSLYCDWLADGRPQNAPPTFELIETNCTILISDACEKGDLSYYLYACNTDEIHVGQAIDSDMNARTLPEQRALMWTLFNDQAQGLTMWSFKFSDEDQFVQFQNAFVQALYEQKTQQSWQKTKESDRTWYRTVVEAEAESSGSEQEEDRLEDDSDLQNSDFAPRLASSCERNSLLSVGAATDRSFVVRGSRIGVFGVDSSDGGLEHKATIRGVQTLSSKQLFSPKKAFLHRADQNMLLLNPDDSTKVFKMDLERGEVVEEWETPTSELRIFDLVPETKYSQRTHAPTVIGLNNCGFFAMDDRMKEKVVTGRNFQYSSDKLSFRAGATTADGHFALGTAQGDIRLYNASSLAASSSRSAFETPKPRARTNLPGCGDAITGLEVTADGEWILATCRTYLLVAPTKCDDVSGFAKSLGENKPSPIILRLKPEHIASLGGTVCFKQAHFNIGGVESSIVASTGNAVVTWNFDKVKRGHSDSYVIKLYSDMVVANNFARYGTDNEIIIALPDDVKLARKSGSK